MKATDKEGNVRWRSDWTSEESGKTGKKEISVWQYWLGFVWL